MLSGIAPPDIGRNVCARVEQTKQMREETHSLFGNITALSRLKSRKCFLTSVQPVHFLPKVIKCNVRQRRLCHKSHVDVTHLHENLAKGHDCPWLTWRCRNRLRTGYTCSKEQRKRWGYFDGHTTCECGLATENTGNMLQYTLLTHPCTLDDPRMFNDQGKQCAERWKIRFDDTR